MLQRALTEATSDPAALDIVLTCPASWGAARRAVLLSAAPIGATLIDEPIAAAQYFADVGGTTIPDGGTAVVYDFGAGTFDAAVVRRTGSTFAILAADGVPDCGGLDIDAAIVAHLAQAFTDATAWHRLEQPTSATERRARAQLWTNVREAKEMLSRTSSTLVHMPLIEVDAPLSREDLDRLAAPVLERTAASAREALTKAHVDASDLTAIILSGGSSRMPAVGSTLHRAFGILPASVDQPELAVAEGSLLAGAAATTRHVASTTPPVNTPAGETAAFPDHPGPAATHSAEQPPPTGWRARPLATAAAFAAVLAVAVGTAIVIADRDDNDSPNNQKAQAANNLTGTPVSSPSRSVSPSPTYPAGVDPCLLGTWRSEKQHIYADLDGGRALFTGGGGTLYTYRADGTSTADYSRTQPRTGSLKGSRYSSVIRRSATTPRTRRSTSPPPRKPSPATAKS
ncbi:Hsp70 family protein [Cryptosporangium sp. NPDC048952]|uniref:Hsp70 family protein n=1 Tax=Cryptosporangium sp. NPDC048952 TaxID=3363961 RepID=UPI00372208E5